MKKQTVLTLALTASLSTANAHNLWIVPSQTQLSGDEAWVTFDAAASNQLFVANHASLDLHRMQVWSPDNQPVEKQNAMQGEVRSVFDVQLTEAGTYQIIRTSNSVMARYEKDGEKKRWWGTLPEYLFGKYPEGIPAEAFTAYVGQAETFVTLGAPSTTTVAPTKYGLDIDYLTHPNDLITGEVVNFRVLVDGQPAPNIDVEIIAGGSQYRDNVNALKLTSNAEGEITVIWQQAGMYWLNAESNDNKGLTPSKKRKLSYTAILQVLPE